MTSPAVYLNAAEAARRLGVSAKALRIYERRGLIAPARTAAGWRAYGPDVMARTAKIVALRGLGLSLGQIAGVLDGHGERLEAALAAHQAMLELQAREMAATIDKVGRLRAQIASGAPPDTDAIAELTARPTSVPGACLRLPWPWGGEEFVLREARPLTYITGPLGSGKTRLAKLIADTLPNAAFLGLDRWADNRLPLQERLDSDPTLRLRVDRALEWLVDDGATASHALTVLLAALELDAFAVLVVDMIEQGLDTASQEALIAFLRRRGTTTRRPLFMLTRSSAILDLADVGPNETIILCPANHSPPTYVAPVPGAPGYEAVATCLASPEVRARTAGVIAWRTTAS